MEKLLNFNPNKPREPVITSMQIEVVEKPVESSFMDDEERSDLF